RPNPNDLNVIGSTRRKYSVNPCPTSELRAFSRKSWYKGGHGKDPVTSHNSLCACTGPREGCDALCPTDRGADETDRYRAYLAGALLADADGAQAGGGNTRGGGGRSRARA